MAAKRRYQQQNAFLSPQGYGVGDDGNGAISDGDCKKKYDGHVDGISHNAATFVCLY